MPKQLAWLALVVGAFSSFGATARDLGVQGNTYEIIERDFRADIAASAARADWGAVQEKAQDSARNYLDTLPKRSFEEASELSILYVDPSITLEDDIKVPRQQADGSFTWEILYSKGERFNPLTKYRPAAAMLMFDGSNEAQIEFAQQVIALHPYRVTLVDVSGANVGKLAERLGRPVFYANDFMLSRVPIRYAPSLIYPGQEAQALLLGVAAFARPFDPKVIDQVWPAQPGVVRVQ